MGGACNLDNPIASRDTLAFFFGEQEGYEGPREVTSLSQQEGRRYPVMKRGTRMGDARCGSAH
jgi:hypothetical protein